MLLLIVSPIANAQSRYKHPRVKVEKNRTEDKIEVSRNDLIIPVEVTAPIVIEESTPVITEIASSKNEILIVPQKKSTSKFP